MHRFGALLRTGFWLMEADVNHFSYGVGEARVRNEDVVRYDNERCRLDRDHAHSIGTGLCSPRVLDNPR
jgi:hypothetical protein